MEDVNFLTKYNKWLNAHMKRSKGERRRKLAGGLGHAEKLFLRSVWWQAFGHFDGLSPEYEVRDFKDGSRFIDFAYQLGNLQIAIEIDGFGPHWRNADRWQFADHLLRQNHLVIDGWKMLRFSFDDITEKPRRCEQILQQAFGKWVTSATDGQRILAPMECAILQWAETADAPLTPIKAALALGVHRKTTAKHFQALVEKGYFSPVAADSKRVMRYFMCRKP